MVLVLQEKYLFHGELTLGFWRYLLTKFADTPSDEAVVLA